MQIIKNNTNNTIFDDFQHYFSTDDVCFFDIETTGFAADHTKLYLIGCCYIMNQKLHIIQWFNDDGESEFEIIDAFMNFVSNYKYLLHFNGDGFDLPYIEKKCNKLGINNILSSIQSYDLYKKIKPFKALLHLDNLKLKSIEQFLGIYREDQYTGGELIDIYKQYLKHPDNQAFDTLMLHNFEDLIGLVDCFKMLSLTSLTNADFKLNNLSVKSNNICFELSIPASMPKRVIYSSNGIVLSIHKNNVVVSVPMIEDTLHLFYDNPADYYYLPAEDTAIHKSVAAYVDKSHREKAKRENCYTNVQGIFITQLDNQLTTQYKRNYNDKFSYIMLDDSFLENQALLFEYISYILKNLY